MCNLSQGIKEDAMIIGEKRGIAIGEATAEARIIINMHNNGYTAEKIAEVTGKALADVEAVIAGKREF